MSSVDGSEAPEDGVDFSSLRGIVADDDLDGPQELRQQVLDLIKKNQELEQHYSDRVLEVHQKLFQVSQMENLNEFLHLEFKRREFEARPAVVPGTLASRISPISSRISSPQLPQRWAHLVPQYLFIYS